MLGVEGVRVRMVIFTDIHNIRRLHHYYSIPGLLVLINCPESGQCSVAMFLLIPSMTSTTTRKGENRSLPGGYHRFNPHFPRLSLLTSIIGKENTGKTR